MLENELKLKLESYIEARYVAPGTVKIKTKKIRTEPFANIIEICKEACSKSIKFNDDFSVDESFSEYLLRLIDKKGITDVECYTRAKIDRKLFSKIRSNKNYQPSKPTVLLLCISLRLNVSESMKLLKKAGYTFSDYNKFDIIVRWYIKERIYDLMKIDESLLEHDQKTLSKY